jgi:ankyrin repeat protein
LDEPANSRNAAHIRVGSPGSGDSTSVSNPYDFQANIVDHFGKRANGEDLSGAFSRNLRALLPENAVHGHPTDLQMTPTSRSSSDAVKFLDLTLFMVSNKFLGPDSDTSTEVYQWIKRHSNAGLLEYLLSMNGPTVEALAEQLFWLAIEMEDATTVKRILESGLDSNELRCTHRCGVQVTPLQRACELRNLGLVRVLLDAGADVNKFSLDSSSPLAYAVAPWDDIMDHVEIELVQILLRAGANINPAPDSSPLLDAAESAHVELVSVLLAAGADPNFSEAVEGTTPLMYAVQSDGDIADITNIARQLLRAGADASATSCYEGSEEASVLERALSHNSIELIQILLDAGARITEASLIGAVRSSNLDIVKLFLRFGARITQKAIEEAASYGGTEVLWLLLDSTEDRIKEGSRSSALTAAIRHKKKDLIDTLSASGVELRSTNELAAAIEAAAEEGDISVLRFLLNDESPYRSSAVESLGGSLYSAVAAGRTEVIDLLLVWLEQM